MICLAKVYKYCRDDVRLIENFDKALVDRKNEWVCHHRLEVEELPDGRTIYRSVESLIASNHYYDRPANELIFLLRGEHSALHNGSDVMRNAIAEKNKNRDYTPMRKPKSYFGQKYYEHYGFTKAENKTLYAKELNYYLRNNIFSWEKV